MKIEKLITKASKGDKKAFSRLIELEQEKLYRMAFIYTKNKDDALDIVQETVYKALHSINSLREVKYFSTWITKILINTSLDYIKKKKKLVLVDYDLGESVPDKKLEIDFSIDLYQAVDLLNDRYKTIVILRFYQDLTIKQIAELLETPEGTIKSNLHRAIKMLKATLLEGDCINE